MKSQSGSIDLTAGTNIYSGSNLAMTKKLLVLACIGLFMAQPAFADGERQRNTNTAPPVVNGSPITCTNAIVKDCSFEDIGNGMPSPWIDFSTTFGTGICDIGACGTGGGTTGPFAGAFWAWLGGSAAPAEITSEGQQIIIPSNPGGSTTLTFQLWAGECNGGAGDFFEVTVDGTQIFRIDANDPSCGAATYSQRSANLGPFADGGSHLLQFLANTGNSGAVTNFSLDDINVVALGPPPIPPAPVVPVPTMGQWSLLGLAGVAGLFGLVAVRRRQRKV